MALIAREDPGLVVLPTHRLLQDVSLPDDFIARLEREFRGRGRSDDGAAGGTCDRSCGSGEEQAVAFGLATSDRSPSHPPRARCRRLSRTHACGLPALPGDRSTPRSEAVVLRGMLGIDQQTAAADGSLAFTHDGEEALRLGRIARMQRRVPAVAGAGGAGAVDGGRGRAHAAEVDVLLSEDAGGAGHEPARLEPCAADRAVAASARLSPKTCRNREICARTWISPLPQSV